MPGHTVVLNFHGVGTPSRSLDDGEASVWVEEASFLRILDEVVGMDGICLTFDDGNSSDLSIAAPALEERGLTAEFFVLAGLFDSSGYLDEAEVIELASRGMTIGSHGLHHRPWRGLPDPELDEEIVGARSRLEDLLQTPVDHAACPFGSYDRRVLQRLRKADVRRVYTSDRGLARSDAWFQPRNTIKATDGAGTANRVLAQAHQPLERVLRTIKGWMKRLR